MKRFNSVERIKERAEKHHCDGVCYGKHFMCPLAETCDETRVKEFIFGLWAHILTILPIIFITVYLLRVYVFK